VFANRRLGVRRARPRVGVVRVQRGAVRRPVASPTELKSPGLAAILAFFCAGLGHFYVGAFGRGLLFFLVVPVSVSFLVLFGAISVFSSASSLGGAFENLNLLVLIISMASIAAHAFQIMDAYACAEESNRRFARR
jgi:hypothetical protein